MGLNNNRPDCPLLKIIGCYWCTLHNTQTDKSDIIVLSMEVMLQYPHLNKLWKVVKFACVDTYQINKLLALLYSKREILPRESLMEKKIKFRAKMVMAGKPQFFTIKLLVNPDMKWKLPAKTLSFFFFLFFWEEPAKTHLIRQMQEFLSTHHTLKLYYKKCM